VCDVQQTNKCASNIVAQLGDETVISFLFSAKSEEISEQSEVLWVQSYNETENQITTNNSEENYHVCVYNYTWWNILDECFQKGHGNNFCKDLWKTWYKVCFKEGLHHANSTGWPQVVMTQSDLSTSDLLHKDSAAADYSILMPTKKDFSQETPSTVESEVSSPSPAINSLPIATFLAILVSVSLAAGLMLAGAVGGIVWCAENKGRRKPSRSLTTVENQNHDDDHLNTITTNEGHLSTFLQHNSNMRFEDQTQRAQYTPIRLPEIIVAGNPAVQGNWNRKNLLCTVEKPETVSTEFKKRDQTFSEGGHQTKSIVTEDSVKPLHRPTSVSACCNIGSQLSLLQATDKAYYNLRSRPESSVYLTPLCEPHYVNLCEPHYVNCWTKTYKGELTSTEFTEGYVDMD